MEKAHLPFKKWLKKKKKPRIMRHEECLREFGIFNLEKINRNMIEMMKLGLYNSSYYKYIHYVQGFKGKYKYHKEGNESYKKEPSGT